MSRPRRRRRGPAAEAGISLVEVSLAVILSAILAASLVGVMYSLSQNASDAGRTADLQRTGRQVVAQLVMDLRQAVAVSGNGDPIESLNADRVVFYSDREETEGPERVVYERTGCGGGECDLRVTRYPAVIGSGPEWEFATVPMEQAVIMERVANDQPLFRGAAWTGSPAAETYISTCSGDCSFTLVAIRLRALPQGTSAGATTIFELTEEVELRNAG